MNTTESYWWEVNISLGNDFMPSGNKPLPESMCTKFFEAICRHYAIMSWSSGDQESITNWNLTPTKLCAHFMRYTLQIYIKGQAHSMDEFPNILMDQYIPWNLTDCSPVYVKLSGLLSHFF